MVRVCVFCKVARRKEQARRIYQDKDVMAFLDTRPINEEHTPVISRKHYENMFELAS